MEALQSIKHKQIRITTHAYIIANAYYVPGNSNMKCILVNEITGLLLVYERDRQRTCK